MTEKVVLIVQARMSSTRLPGKMLRPIAGTPAIGHVIDRVKRAERPDAVWLACSEAANDDPLAQYVAGLGISVLRGDEDDVLSRFVAVAEQTEADVIVRITGDCPMADPQVIDAVIDRFLESGADFASNTLERTFPDGLDVEVFSRAALDRANAEADHPFLRAHVTPYIHGRLKDRLPSGDFNRVQLVHEQDFSHLRWTLDEADDLEFLDRLLADAAPGYGWLDAVALLTKKPELLAINAGHGINEGTDRDLNDGASERRYDRSTAFFDRAVKTVPLGTQTFSKSYQQWVKGAGPLFIDHGRGCRVWDLDGNDYIDHVLGLLPVVLGYRDADVDMAVAGQLQKGICFSLASPLEAELSERLVRLIPSAEKVRFGKNGSDVTTGAIRLARAYTGRDKVVVCGYHGWHDWYIGTTTRDLGVPRVVKALTETVPFNELDQLTELLARDGDQIAAVIMEPTSKDPVADGYLEGVRAVTERHGVVLVFDEIITGFRVAMGGAQARHGVTPDISCFGKAMGNGLPISAIVGRAEVMAGMEDIFFSATFGGEALSLAGAIATIDKLEAIDGPSSLNKRGEILMQGMNRVFDAAGLGGVLQFGGESWWPRLGMTAPPVDGNLLTSLLRQSFFAEGLFIGAGLNLCLAHDEDAVTQATLAAAERAMQRLTTALNAPDPADHLRGDPVQPTFAVRS